MADSAAGRHFMSAGFLFESTRDRTEVLEAQRARPETRPPTEAAGWELPGERVDLTVPIRFNLK